MWRHAQLRRLLATRTVMREQRHSYFVFLCLLPMLGCNQGGTPFAGGTGGTTVQPTGGAGGGGGAPVINLDAGVISQDAAASTVVVPGVDGGSVAACAYSTSKVDLIPLDLGLLVDTSASMDYLDKWVKVSGALEIVSESSNYVNIGVALQYFPLRLTCDETSYATPAVAMATLPGVGAALRASLESKRMSGGTPLVQAMRGMGTYLVNWATANPTHRTVLVIATDGIPDATCAGSTPPNSVDEAVVVATALSGGTFSSNAPKIPVFVIGVGDDLTSLNAIASAGGSGSATLISTGDNVDKQFIAALDAIRTQSLSCDYAIPVPQSGTLDLQAVNVSLVEGSSRETLLYVADSSDCSAAADKGWHFDSATSPSKIVLCPETCDRVSSTVSGEVDVIFGCTRVDFIP